VPPGIPKKHLRIEIFIVIEVVLPVHQAASEQRQSPTEIEAIMRHSVKICDLIVMVLLLVFFLPAGSRQAWSQTQAASPVTAQPARSAAPLSTSATTSAAAETMQKNPTVPVIGAGDLLKVSVLGAPDSDQEVRVDASGNVSLNFIGAVPVAGKTTEQAQAAIAKKYVAGGFFTDPQVSVFAKEYVTQGVSVLGEVQKPGVYPILGARTLFDVLSLAGGTTPKAGKVVSITHRDKPQTPISVSLSNDAAESVRSNVDIYPGDTIVVSKAGIVYIVGDVHRPSGVPMENGSMTVLQAIAMAEGTNPTAKLNGAKLIRKSANGPVEMPLALKDMLASKSPDVHLQAEDIIFVPSSVAKNATKRTLEAIIQTATGVAIYGVRP
jgi:polysaccharide export outer membrane protein